MTVAGKVSEVSVDELPLTEMLADESAMDIYITSKKTYTKIYIRILVDKCT